MSVLLSAKTFTYRVNEQLIFFRLWACNFCEIDEFLTIFVIYPLYPSVVPPWVSCFYVKAPVLVVLPSLLSTVHSLHIMVHPSWRLICLLQMPSHVSLMLYKSVPWLTGDGYAYFGLNCCFLDVCLHINLQSF